MPPRPPAGSSATDRGGLPARHLQRSSPEDDHRAAGTFMALPGWAARCGLGGWVVEDLLVGGDQAGRGGGPLPGVGVAGKAREGGAGHLHPGCGGRGRSGGRSPTGPPPRPVRPGRRRRPARAGSGGCRRRRSPTGPWHPRRTGAPPCRCAPRWRARTPLAATGPHHLQRRCQRVGGEDQHVRARLDPVLPHARVAPRRRTAERRGGVGRIVAVAARPPGLGLSGREPPAGLQEPARLDGATGKAPAVATHLRAKPGQRLPPAPNDRWYRPAGLAVLAAGGGYRVAPADPRLLRAVVRRIDCWTGPTTWSGTGSCVRWCWTCSAACPDRLVPPAARCCKH
jgi:hypothetical protein